MPKIKKGWLVLALKAVQVRRDSPLWPRLYHTFCRGTWRSLQGACILLYWYLWTQLGGKDGLRDPSGALALVSMTVRPMLTSSALMRAETDPFPLVHIRARAILTLTLTQTTPGNMFFISLALEGTQGLMLLSMCDCGTTVTDSEIRCSFISLCSSKKKKPWVRRLSIQTLRLVRQHFPRLSAKSLDCRKII